MEESGNFDQTLAKSVNQTQKDKAQVSELWTIVLRASIFGTASRGIFQTPAPETKNYFASTANQEIKGFKTPSPKFLHEVHWSVSLAVVFR